MSKTIPCFICRVPVEATDKAIAKLCPEHDTAENQKQMVSTPVHQLLRIVDDGIRQELSDSQKETMATIESLKQKIKQLEDALQTKVEVNDIPTPTPPTAPSAGQVNEFGEII